MSASFPPEGSRAPDLDKCQEVLRPDYGLRDPRLQKAAEVIESGRFGAAERLVREYLTAQPSDLSAARLLAEALIRLNRNDEAEALLAQALPLAPDAPALRFAYAEVLQRNQKFEPALAEGDKLLEQDPHNPMFRIVRALALEALEDSAGAAAIWHDLVEDYPKQSDFWLRYGHALRGMGAGKDCIAAYRTALELDPALGRGYWALANLKTYRFSDAEISEMERLLATGNLPVEARTQLHFSLGKALGDAKAFDKSFGHYARGNALHRLGLKHDPDVLTPYVARCKTLFTPEFFRVREGYGCPDNSPIFLVGMLRAGSTLVEQILASHSEVEGTRELFESVVLVKHMEAEAAVRNRPPLPDLLKEMSAVECRAFGSFYLESVRVHRRQGRPFFVDKMGANFARIALLHLILPNAKIVDVRRHPLACGLSNFTELFAVGQNFSYRLSDIGCMYRDYVELMAHFDRVLPGKVHRIFYEELVGHPEREIRRLLNYLELPFEAGCLKFYETDRVLTTASSEQVRQPIYRDALEQWRAYEPWLGPLKSALGPVLDTYPGVPDFA